MVPKVTSRYWDVKVIESPTTITTINCKFQQGKAEPDIGGAIAIGDHDLDLIETKYNSSVYDFVQKLPGITSKNVDRFLRSGVNMQTVVQKTEVPTDQLLCAGFVLKSRFLGGTQGYFRQSQ